MSNDKRWRAMPLLAEHWKERPLRDYRLADLVILAGKGGQKQTRSRLQKKRFKACLRMLRIMMAEWGVERMKQLVKGELQNPTPIKVCRFLGREFEKEMVSCRTPVTT